MRQSFALELRIARLTLKFPLSSLSLAGWSADRWCWPCWSPFEALFEGHCAHVIQCYPMLSCWPRWPRRTRRSRVVQLTWLVVSNVALSDRAPKNPMAYHRFPVFPLKWPFFFPAPMFRHTCMFMFKNHIWDDDPQRLLWLIQGLQTTYQQNTVSGHKNEPETNYCN